jgi:anthranilate synthase/aminodeoxychorismate synthase-like glutamine amidotransferase
MGARVLVVDNYDSFTFNLVQLIGGLGAEPVVHRNDQISTAEIRALEPDGILISPGPGRPVDAGISRSVIEEFGSVTPVLGVCLGHQCIGEVFGGRIVQAPELMHGKTSWISHRGVGVLAGLSNPFEATRYHSLVVERSTLPDILEVTAETADGTVMGVRHIEWPIEGVQFHPESILTAEGPKLLENWLSRLSSVRPSTARSPG